MDDFHVNSNETLMIGDDLECDIQWANDLWIQTIHTKYPDIETLKKQLKKKNIL
jgi:FMN phosphatase YigB (HAD superfamily)